MSICFTFRIEDRDPGQEYLQGWDPRKVYYYNGDVNEIAYIHNEDELGFLRQTYKETRGQDLKHYVWNTQAPVFIRIFGALKPWTGAGGMKKAVESMKAKVDAYEDVYWKPKFFIPRVALHIRREPTRVAESLGICDINRKYEVLGTITQCDWHWAKINHNGIIGWIAMGDLTGEWYGEKLRY